ncbi:MAG: hypothetical protein HXX81_01510, partial [Campylobacterales bacterium]|nr:hypothetical protein [Campylobacterales bacterium]
MIFEDYYIYGGFGVAFLFVLAYLYIKDLEQSKKMKLYEKSIEDLNLQLFKLRKEIKSKEMDNDFLDIETDKRIKEHVQKELANAINQIVPILESVEHSIKNFKTEIE